MIVRPATTDDVPALRELIELSVRGLSTGHYSAVQIDAALDEVFGVDTQLIADGTYYVVDGAAGPAAAGGFRRFELMATLPGESLYVALGFSAVERVVLPLGAGVAVPLIRMMRHIDPRE